MRQLLHWTSEIIAIIQLIVIVGLTYSYYKLKQNVKKLSKETEHLKSIIIHIENDTKHRLAKFFERVRKEK